MTDWYPFKLPKDWSDLIGYIEEHYGWWEEDIPPELKHLWGDFRFYRVAFDIFNKNFFSWGLPQDKEFILDSLKQYPDITSNWYGSRNIKLSWWYEDPSFVSELIQNNYSSYRNAPKKLRWNKSFALNAVSINGAVLEFSPRVIRNDLEIASEALKTNPLSIHFLTKATRSLIDDSITDHCLKISKGSKEEIFKIKNKQVITNLFISCMNRSNSAQHLISPVGHFSEERTYPLNMDLDILLYAMDINPELITYIRMSELENLGKLLKEALGNNPFLNVERIQKVQTFLFETYIERTKDLDFLNPIETAGNAKRISGL